MNNKLQLSMLCSLMCCFSWGLQALPRAVEDLEVASILMCSGGSARSRKCPTPPERYNCPTPPERYNCPTPPPRYTQPTPPPRYNCPTPPPRY
ncbi:MAG: hypothetical protein UR26_C0003G0052 [candidate division TM6 bacterium GW2011_GWF2_32_72]|nr:MAG: hypothetical protein UR26_C0003G0052 [candidate division TM6 bacterium GW2011_GWF2_32_72]